MATYDEPGPARPARDHVLAGAWLLLVRVVRHEPFIFALSVGGGILFGLLTIAGAGVVGRAVGSLVVPAFADHRMRAGTLILAVVAIFAISVLKVAALFARRLGACVLQFRLHATYRRAVAGRYLDLPVAWHQRHQTGFLLATASTDVDAAWSPVVSLPFAVGSLTMLVGSLVALLVTDPVLALVGVAVFPALFACNAVYSRRMAPRAARAQQLRGELAAFAYQSFDGALLVKSMGQEAAQARAFVAIAEQLRDELVRVGRVRGLLDPVMEALPSVGTLAMLGVGSWRLSTGATTVAGVVGAAFLFTVLAFPVRAIGWVLGDLPRGVAGWRRVTEILEADQEMAYGGADLPAGDRPPVLAFDAVGFAYQGGPPILREVSFTVSPGRTVALVGATGSGKSTAVSLACRLFDPVEGRVLLGGLDVRTLRPGALARGVALVPQVPFLFADTVRGNVTLGRDIDDRAVWAALRAAQADGFVAKLGGLDARLGERGVDLSGGQRQRLTIARALAAQPVILVLDDATSAVDPPVEVAILAAIAAAYPATSLLVVTHRPATLAVADEIAYLDGGRVVMGTHEDLCESAPGYAAIVATGNGARPAAG
jgi:ABC-type multidrug transport system fused ATPase/permease subunit